MKILKNLFLLAIIVAASLEVHAYDYKNQAKWYGLGAECHLYRQSPIELNTLTSLPGFFIPSLKFHNFNIPFSNTAILENNGVSADIQLLKSSDNTAHISGGPFLLDKYDVESIHFHWGSDDNHGSEHVIDSQRFSMEMHIVSRNRKYKTIDEATHHYDGLSVLAIFFQVDPYQKEEFFGLNQIINFIPAIVELNNTIELDYFLLADLLGNIDTGEFFTYKGSLTTPPCSQVVTWIVFPEAIYISDEQISLFRLLLDSDGNNLENNYRHLQAKGRRKVFLRRSNLFP